MVNPQTLDRQRLHANLERVREQIGIACQACGRESHSVKLVAVTKYVDEKVIRDLVRCGQLDIAENRPQQLARKFDVLNDAEISWHMVGHLQRNKVRLVVPRCKLVHSVDSLRLAQTVNEEAKQLGVLVRCLFEVNISGEPSKHGLMPDEIEPVLEAVANLEQIQVDGLMAMSGLDSTRDQSLRQFQQVRELRDSVRASMGGRFSLAELSMGMSGDFQQAIAAGSTLVRIGSALFD